MAASLSLVGSTARSRILSIHVSCKLICKLHFSSHVNLKLHTDRKFWELAHENCVVPSMFTYVKRKINCNRAVAIP